MGSKCVDCFCGPVDKMWTMKVWTTVVSAIISPAPNHIHTSNPVPNPNRNTNLNVSLTLS